MARMLPNCLIDKLMFRAIDSDFGNYPERHRKVLHNYATLMFKLGQSDTEKALTASFKWGCYPYHCLTAEDRLGNPRLPFPVAFCYGA